MPRGVDLSRGIDLAPIRDKAKYQHRWIYVGNFAVEDRLMAAMAEQRLRALRRQEKGLDPAEGAKVIQIPMTMENLVGTDGPGCLKCGITWIAAEGWGRLCTVSDDKYAAMGSPVTTPPPHPSVDTTNFPDAPDDERARALVADELQARAGTYSEAGAHVVLDERGNVVREIPNT